jgi:hypothetical protein
VEMPNEPVNLGEQADLIALGRKILHIPDAI